MSRERNQNRLLAHMFCEGKRFGKEDTTHVFWHEIPGSHGMQAVEATLNGELMDETGILYPMGEGWKFFWGTGWDHEKGKPIAMEHYGPFESAEHAQGAMLKHIDWETYMRRAEAAK